MNRSAFAYYFKNCFLLIIPVLAWNAIAAPLLPAVFRPEVFSDIPLILMYAENISRVAMLVLALLMPFSVITGRQLTGLMLYIAGALIYVGSWLVLIFGPAEWRSHLLVFMAPAYTPLLWLSGIAMAGKSFYFSLPYRWWLFPGTALSFLILHNLHAFIIFDRTY